MQQIVGTVDWRASWTTAAEKSPRAARAFAWAWLRPFPVLVALCAALGALVQPLATNGDGHLFALSAERLLGPDGLNVFDNPGLQVGPSYLLFLGVVSRIADVLGLPVWPVLGAVQSALIVTLALLVTRRATSILAAQWAVGLSLVFGGLLVEAVLSGHPEELAAGLLLILAAQAARRGSMILAPVLVGLAATSKLWAVVGIVVLLYGLPAGRKYLERLSGRIGVLSLFGLVAYGPFLFYGHVNTFDLVWNCDPNSALGLVTGYSGPFSYSMRLLQVILAVGIGLVLLRRGSEPPIVVLGLVSARLLSDPLRQDYYWTELLLLVVIAVWCGSGATRTMLRWLTLACLPLLVLASSVMSARVGGSIHLGLLLAVLAGCLLSTTRRQDTAAQLEPSTRT